ncbi:MAG TPA: FKBP-type peptidyl-prolyl cis-trans isomerase [Pirellulales bacterium]|jgi:FKBP-type peptidyl-prolyl cis-trans isomerase|nr:FKBP-type peptidyl-prolyl cis-trans isomerase [Pirellulales bacterium]
MRVFCLTWFAAALLTSVCQAQPAADNASKADTAPKTDKDKVSYSMGFDIGKKIGKDFKSNGIEMDATMFAQGLKEGLGGAKPVLTEEEMKQVLDAFRKEMIAAAPKRAKELAEKNKKDGEAFLAANAKKPGVTTTKSGLQIKVLKEGTGETPKATDTVKTHYHGTLIDGTVFDSSVERGEPVSFPVKGVIPGWTEALQLMKVGEKAQLVIPSALAYGEDGSPPDIMPNSTLVFEIELLAIEKPKAKAEGLPKFIDKE